MDKNFDISIDQQKHICERTAVSSSECERKSWYPFSDFFTTYLQSFYTLLTHALAEKKTIFITIFPGIEYRYPY